MTRSGGDPVAAGRTARRAALASIALLAASVGFTALHSGTWPGNLLLAIALLVPLALPLPGILRRRRRTFVWATLCVTPYFIYGTTEAVANPAARPAAGIILGASLALFVALVAYLRLTRSQAAAVQSS